MTVQYEDTGFHPDPNVDHKTCDQCGGKGEIGISTACNGMTGEPYYQYSPCSCYQGKILTDYEKAMQAEIYRWANRARAAEAKVATLEWSIKQFHKRPIFYGLRRKLPSIEFWRLQQEERGLFLD